MRPRSARRLRRISSVDNSNASIFVVAHNGGYEGHSLPMLAFSNKADAVLWCLSQTECYDIAEVPIFPNLPSKPWFRLEPVKL